MRECATQVLHLRRLLASVNNVVHNVPDVDVFLTSDWKPTATAFHGFVAADRKMRSVGLLRPDTTGHTNRRAPRCPPPWGFVVCGCVADTTHTPAGGRHQQRAVALPAWSAATRCITNASVRLGSNLSLIPSRQRIMRPAADRTVFHLGAIDTRRARGARLPGPAPTVRHPRIPAPLSPPRRRSRAEGSPARGR